MKIVVVEPNIEPYETEIKNDFRAFQKVVGGYWTITRPTLNGDPKKISENDLVVVCNEEGIPRNLTFNRGYYGTWFISRTKGEEFESLTDEECKRFIRIIRIS